jgi:NAD(P)H-quinone oxidoreductase subunit 5
MTSLAPWLPALGPLALLLVGALPRADARPRRIADLGFAAALLAFVLALAATAAVIAWGGLHTPTIGFAGGGLGLGLDALSAAMTLLVSFVGAAVIRFSRNYLDGDPRHGSFIQRLCRTVAAVLLLVVSGNLVLLLACWIATGVGLHGLLLVHPQRRAAVLAARKKFVASRIGDACLAIAAVLLFARFGAFDFATLFAAVEAQGAAATGPLVHAACLLVALAAILKSAQFPLHGWLLEVMETPTPVSALLHAGIINAGGFLVLRLSPVMVHSVPSLDLLAVVGAATALVGSLVMLTQTSIKVALAWSTVAQMGFMLLQCGLGAFAAALLHLLAHALYKAHAFLSSGSVIDIQRAAWTPLRAVRPHPARGVIALAAVLAATAGIAALFGAGITQKPGVFALGAIVGMGVMLWLANAIDAEPAAPVMLRALGGAAAVVGAWFALQRAAEHLFGAALAPTQALSGGTELAIVCVVLAAFAGVTLLQTELGARMRSPAWAALYVHLANGLYVNTLANRAAIRLWPAPRTAPARQG